MIYCLYTVLDKIADESGPIFCAKNDAVANRSFNSMLKDIAPNDRDSYVLYTMGTFDTDTMELEKFKAREVMASLNMYVEENDA